MSGSKKKILVQINSSYDLYACTALIRDQRNQFQADLLLPEYLYASLPKKLKNTYDQVISFQPRIRSLLSIDAIRETLRLTRWARRNRDGYQALLFGAYRNDITSLLARHFKGRAGLIAIKQGIDISDVRYQRYRSFRELHDDFYYWLFGYGSFRRERLIQGVSEFGKSDYLFMRPVWKRDPFDRCTDVFTIGVSQDGLDDGTPFVLPNFSLMRKDYCRQLRRQGILIIGERTPMTPSWGEEQNKRLRNIFKILLHESAGEQVYVRARKNLTKNVFYSQLAPVFLDPDQLYDDQLLELNPRLVISVKSTATKVAAYYGFNALVLYPCLGFVEAEVEHLDYLFGDGAPIKRIETIGEFAGYLSKPRMEPEIDTQFRKRSLDLFFERINAAK